MPYPTAYRGSSRRPQNGRAASAPDPLPPLLVSGHVAGIATAYWAFSQLGAALQGYLDTPQTTQDPAAHGWTLTLNCGRTPAVRHTAGFLGCGLQIVGASSYRATAITLWPASGVHYLWAVGGVYNPTLLRWEQVPPAQRWDRASASYQHMHRVPALAGAPPRALRPPFGRPVPFHAQVGASQRGYEHPVDAYRPWYGAPRLVFGENMRRDIIDYLPDRPNAPPRPVVRPTAPAVVVPRAVPYPGMKEHKITSTPAGRGFLAAYIGFAILGDFNGLARSLWYALPRQRRGKSRRLTPMLADIYTNFAAIDWSKAYFNVARWKFQELLVGSLDGAAFAGVQGRYGIVAARAFSTLNSAAVTAYGFSERAWQRAHRDTAQQSSRG